MRRENEGGHLNGMVTLFHFAATVLQFGRMATPQKPKKSNRDRLAPIIRNRLELDDEWFPLTSRPSFFDKIRPKDWREFETAFRRVLDLGCRGDVVLTCLARFDTYNTEEIVLEKARYDSDGELSARPKTRRQRMSRPPGKDERDSFRRSLDAAAGGIKRYEDLLLELGQFEAPPSIFAPEYLSADGTVVPPPTLSSDDAIAHLPKLLKWCEKLLSDKSFGNFRTVESVGRLIPCVYVELVANSKRERGLGLQGVADLLYEINQSAGGGAAQFREAMRRFQRDHASIYEQLRRKILALHHSAKEAPEGWQRLFSDERERRSRLKP